MAEVLWTSSAAACATGGQSRRHWQATGITLDSRRLRRGDLFVAVRDRRDGHRFVPDAFRAGAAAAMVSGPVDPQSPALVVDDTARALERLAAAARDRGRAIRVAVTGSVGKTSVKEMLARAFDAAGGGHASKGSYNNHWGVPLSLASMPATTARAVFEIGTSTVGEIAPRSRLIAPHLVAVTGIAPAHLSGLGSLEAIATEKAGILAGLVRGGPALLPADGTCRDFLLALVRRTRPDADIARFGLAEDAEARLADMEPGTDDTRYALDVDGQPITVRMRARGVHWGLNAAIVCALASRAGVAPALAAEALAGFEPPPGRGRAVSLRLGGGGSATLLDDAYNANPGSMRAALAALALHPGRKLAALGAMRELGPDSDTLHADLARPVREAGVARLFLAGERMRPLADRLAPSSIPVCWAADADALIDPARQALRPGDALLVKGSNASGMAALAASLTRPGGENRHAG